jgi:branched-chain amino acid transport system substrate-binding protein
MSKRGWLPGVVLAMTLSLGAGAAAAEDFLDIGFTVSRTGPLNVDSLAQLHGFELWRDDANAAGGLKVGDKRYQIRFVTYDDQSVGTRVQQLYTRLIQSDKIQFLLSPYTAGLVATAAVVAEQYGKLMICVGSSEPKTFELGNKNLFQMYTPSNFYAKDALEVIKAKAPDAKVALVFLDSSFPQTVAAAARAEAKAMGLNVVLDESYAPGQTDFSAIINKITASNADALLGGGFYPDSSTLARQLHDRKAPLKWATLLVAPDSNRFASLGDAAVGISVPSQWSPAATYKPDIGPTPAQFAKHFEAKYHPDKPGYHGAAAYGAGLVLQAAIEKSASIDPAKVARELDKTDLTTLFGRTKFSTDPKKHGQQVGHSLVLLQWQMKDGQLVNETIAPESFATAPAKYPMR